VAEYALSTAARGDLETITNYTIDTFGVEQAVSYNAQMHRAAQLVADFPALGSPYVTRGGERLQKFMSGSHALFYQPTDQGVLIVRILHGAMDFERHLDPD